MFGRVKTLSPEAISQEQNVGLALDLQVTTLSIRALISFLKMPTRVILRH